MIDDANIGGIISASARALEKEGMQIFVSKDGKQMEIRGFAPGGYTSFTEIETKKKTLTNAGFSTYTLDIEWERRITVLSNTDDGTITVPPNVFSFPMTVIGFARGGDITFVAGDGMNLRFVGNIQKTTGVSSWKLVFVTATEAYLTIIPHNVLTAKPSLDFPSIPAGDTATLTTTLNGSEVGDNVNVTGPASLYASTCHIQSAWVSAVNTVSIRLKNDGASAVDLGIGEYNIKISK